MQNIFQLTRMVAVAIALMASELSYADASCKEWSVAAVDPAKGKYPLELRICDLTYGLSAYVEIRNMGSQRLALAYRITTNDDKQRDATEVVVEPGVTTRAENCQACASRHAGFKSWEIVSVSEAIDDDKAGSAATAAPLPAFMGGGSKAPAAKTAPVEAVKVVEKTQPAAVKPQTEIPVVKQTVKTPADKPATAAAPAVMEQPKAEAAVPAPAAEAEKESEGFRAEDGTIIPWEKLPPEFRPRK